MWILQSLEGTPAPVTYRLSAGAIKTIGRSTGAELVLDAALVSRLHCRIEAHPETLELTDLASTNGTFVNGTRVAHAHLVEGDRLTVGRVELQVGRSGR